ncbi:unnamed protein product [Somion occarium]|uniref:Uncharacterized protein n=1 Tax=Somion occarium TaxID=3059160 RepID=A0ABP1E490_9APHY
MLFSYPGPLTGAEYDSSFNSSFISRSLHSCMETTDPLQDSSLSSLPESPPDPPKTLFQAGLRALFQLSSFTKQSSVQQRIHAAVMQDQRRRIQEQKKTIGGLVSYALQLEAEVDHSNIALDSAQYKAAELAVSHDHLCKEYDALTTAHSSLQFERAATISAVHATIARLELAEKDVTDANAARAVEQDYYSELLALAAADKAKLEADVFRLTEENSALESQIVDLEFQQLSSAFSIIDGKAALDEERAAHALTSLEVSQLREDVLMLSIGLDIRQAQLDMSNETVSALEGKLSDERTMSAEYQSSCYVAETKVSELVAQLALKEAQIKEQEAELAAQDVLLKRKDDEIVSKDLRFQEQDDQLEALTDAHDVEKEEHCMSVFAAELERDLILESETNLKEDIKIKDDALAAAEEALIAATAAHEDTKLEFTAKLTDAMAEITKVKVDAKDREASLTKQLEQECNAHQVTRQDLDTIQHRLSAVTEDRDATRRELAVTNNRMFQEVGQLRAMYTLAAQDETTFKHALEKYRVLEEKLDTMLKEKRTLELSKRAVEDAFVAKMKRCDALEKEIATLRKVKGRASAASTPTKGASDDKENAPVDHAFLLNGVSPMASLISMHLLILTHFHTGDTHPSQYSDDLQSLFFQCIHEPLCIARVRRHVQDTQFVEARR